MKELKQLKMLTILLYCISGLYIYIKNSHLHGFVIIISLDYCVEFNKKNYSSFLFFPNIINPDVATMLAQKGILSQISPVFFFKHFYTIF